MVSGTPLKRPRQDENENTPLQPRRKRVPRDLFRIPLTPCQPSQPLFSTPDISFKSAPLTPDDFCFHTPSRPPKKQPPIPLLTPEDVERMRKAHREQERERAERAVQAERASKAAKVEEVLKTMRSPQLPLHEFVHEVLTSQDQQHSSQATKLLKSHGQTLLEDIKQRAPALPRYGASVTEMLDKFSLKGFLEDAESIAPTTSNILRQIGLAHPPEGQELSFKDRDLIIATTVCMLIKSRNEHATSFQTPMAIYLLAYGTSRSLFSVLNHAGFTISYTQAVLKLRQLGEERNLLSKETVREHVCMLVWDNLNIALKVAQQRDDNKDSYENGMTATLIPLYGAKQGVLPLHSNLLAHVANQS
ncbi:hypothetical protein D9613_012152 [Agrocybe pediades]|uniref:Uncharacterized protein n=1 Tax=Agrocybe pediades TaxID=84607 RepID=A0A8H4VTC0_9AGAR|nr:hypothetical protein D9613_012152 [Agrocybe pediades]